MAKDFNINCDIIPDEHSDVINETDTKSLSDYGNKLTNDTGFDLNTFSTISDKSKTEKTHDFIGVDLNKYSKEYGYEDYLESGEAKDHTIVEPPPLENEFTDRFTGKEDFIDNMFDNSKSEERSENEGFYKFSNETGDEQIDIILDSFHKDKWDNFSLEEQKQTMTELADYVTADTGNNNPPEIAFRDDMPDSSYGGYNPETNTLEINENMLGDSAEAADTVAHEMWHAHQQQCALDPTCEKGRKYQEGFDNYISPEYDFEGYENQMVEAEAREYAQGFKDRLKQAA